ncbi:MAG TPA: glycosyltransferase family 4 protein [Acetobacteraceae bacterium]|nr:glycosyltransferase family 4 protein [Acetobacteraceae bacterium]
MITLIVPAPFDTVSGGYAYDRRMVNGLRDTGQVVNVIELPGTHPVTDETARSAARGAWASLPRDTLPVIDGLALPAFAGQGDSIAARPSAAIIHHPTALETGFTESDRATLRNTELRLLPRLARLIVTSEPTAERLAADFGVDPARLRVVVPGTDDAPRSSGSDGPGCTILSIGALTPRKGHDVLIRALARLFDLDWRLIIVGSATRDPAHADMLAALADQLGVADKVRFAGEVDEVTLDRLWQKADLFALASYWEGYGMAVAEALKRGLTVAVTAGGSAAALVPPEGGVICPPGDHDQLSKALRRLIFGTGLRREMAEVAWQTGQALPSWETQIKTFADALTI